MHPTEELWREFNIMSATSFFKSEYLAPEPSAGDAHYLLKCKQKNKKFKFLRLYIYKYCSFKTA